MDQQAFIAGGLVGVGLLEFGLADFENSTFDGIGWVARELEIAMIGGAARCDKVFVIDPNDP